MALLTSRSAAQMVLNLGTERMGGFSEHHIMEPEFHQDIYREPCERISQAEGAFQLGDQALLKCKIHRGTQPDYADDEEDTGSMRWRGMLLEDGSRVPADDSEANVCALKSNCVRRGFVDYGLARSVSAEFLEAHRLRSGIERNDVLINSTGDGTIGRVAVFDEAFPAVVDGHITIVRLRDHGLAWYVAAFLSSVDGQRQIYRYINGSSGQVEIYPQDIARVWIRPPASRQHKAAVAAALRGACTQFSVFQEGLSSALALVSRGEA